MQPGMYGKQKRVMSDFILHRPSFRAVRRVLCPTRIRVGNYSRNLRRRVACCVIKCRVRPSRSVGNALCWTEVPIHFARVGCIDDEREETERKDKTYVLNASVINYQSHKSVYMFKINELTLYMCNAYQYHNYIISDINN